MSGCEIKICGLVGNDGLGEEGERVLVGMEEKLPHLRPEAEQ